jgi:hypothetical protein
MRAADSDRERTAEALRGAAVALWALTGMGYFWPVWPILGWGIAVVGPARRIGFGPCRPSASSRH